MQSEMSHQTQQITSSSPRPSYQARQRALSTPLHEYPTGGPSFTLPHESSNLETSQSDQLIWILRIQNLYRIAWIYLVVVLESRESCVQSIGDLDWSRDETIELSCRFESISDSDEEDAAIWSVLKAIRSRFLVMSNMR
jgi:hypothetical protein